MAEMKLSTDEIVDQTNTHMAYRSFVHIPHVGPISAPALPDPNDALERQMYAQGLGVQAGFRGAARDTNPYSDPTDPCHESWDRGYSEAQGKLLLQGISEL
jgi:ribosome modulation factor